MTNTEISRLKPGQFIGKYEIIKLVGRGGMAEVYSASQPDPKRHVAIKVLLDAAMPGRLSERFEREARALALLEHPHILPIYDSGRDPGFYFIVLRLVAV